MNERIADLSDLATAHEGLFLRAALRGRKPSAPAPCGFCFNCESPLPAGRRWCDADCRDDWERAERAGECRACNE